MSIVSGAFNITAVVDGANGESYSILTNTESWHTKVSNGVESAYPDELTWSYIVSDGTTSKTITTTAAASALGLTAKYSTNEEAETTVTSSFSKAISRTYTYITIYLYKGDVCVAEKTIRKIYGVQAVTPMYYLSSSGYELSGGSWSSTPPTSIGDMFLWTKTITRYTDGTTSETEPYCLTSRTAVNKLKNGDEEKSSTTRLMGEYMPFAPLVAGRRYRLTVCATLASDVFRLDLLMSRGNTNKCTLYPIVSTEPQILSEVFTAGYYGELTPEADIQWAYCNIYRNVYTDLDSVTYPQSTIHWIRVEVGLLREQKMYALGTSQTTAPTSGWQSTPPTSVTGYFLWEKTVQYYDDGTQGDVGVACIQGNTGFTGARSRIRYWKEVPTGGYFYSGVAGNEYYDIVVYADEYYKCIVGHSKGSTTPPNDPDHWERAQEDAFIATGLLLADDAVVNLLEGNSILIKKSDGTVTAGMSGVSDGYNIRIWAGSSSPSLAPFRVNEGGEAWLTNAHITGEVNATSGSISGNLSISGSLQTVAGKYGTLYINNQGIQIFTPDAVKTETLLITTPTASITGTDVLTESRITLQSKSYDTGFTETPVVRAKVELRPSEMTFYNYSLLGIQESYVRYGGSGIRGLRVGTGSVSNGNTISLEQDFVRATGTVTLPNASTCYGKIIFVKCDGNVTIKVANNGQFYRPNSMELTSSESWENRSLFFISGGVYWYAFACYYNS